MKAAYIGRIYIENFHAFRGKNEIPIIKDDGTLQQWTVIVGENNSGKTSLLKAVAGLEPQSEYFIFSYSNSARPIGLIESSDDIEKRTSKRITCEIWGVNNINFILRDKELINVTRELVEKDNWGYYTQINNYILNDFEDEVDVELLEVESILEDDRDVARDFTKLKHLKIYGYGVSRKIGNNNGSDDEKLFAENALTLLYNNKYIADFTNWLFQLNFASKNSEDKAVQTKATDRIAHIKNLILTEIFPDISDLRFKTTDDLKNHLEFQTKDGWFQLHELGYGYQTTLAWIFDLSKKMMERYPDSKQPLREPAVVLIDEIDLHLHPAWQRQIINYLSDNFTATQFIVTTHSPHVLQELKEVNLVKLKRENGMTKIIPEPNRSFQGWTIEEILNDVLETPSTHSTRYEELMRKFDEALDNEDFKTAHEIYETLSKILHPNSPDRKILEIQLSQLTA